MREWISFHPIQALAAGMEPEGLKEKFGDRVSFCGGVDTQELLVHGTPEDVRKKVEELKRLFHAGLILSRAMRRFCRMCRRKISGRCSMRSAVKKSRKNIKKKPDRLFLRQNTGKETAFIGFTAPAHTSLT